MKKLIFLDTETTGNEEKDHLCQLAYKMDGVEYCELFKPPLPIPPEASAVCHITNKMVADKPAFLDSPMYATVKKLFTSEDAVCVAHNAPFDVGMLEKEGITVPRYICTLRVAQHLDTEAKIPQYKLQYLRYFLDLEVEATAHDALGDVRVLEKLFERLLQRVATMHGNEERAIEKMIELSTLPIEVKRINFGKYKGQLIKDLAKTDPDYLRWLLKSKLQNPTPIDSDLISTLQKLV